MSIFVVVVWDPPTSIGRAGDRALERAYVNSVSLGQHLSDFGDVSKQSRGTTADEWKGLEEKSSWFTSAGQRAVRHASGGGRSVTKLDLRA
jgi:hypothetical protein